MLEVKLIVESITYVARSCKSLVRLRIILHDLERYLQNLTVGYSQINMR